MVIVSPQISLLPPVGMLFPTQGVGESRGKDEKAKGCPSPIPQPCAAAGGLGCLHLSHAAKKHEMGMEKMLHVGLGEKKN